MVCADNNCFKYFYKCVMNIINDFTSPKYYFKIIDFHVFFNEKIAVVII